MKLTIEHIEKIWDSKDVYSKLCNKYKKSIEDNLNVKSLEFECAESNNSFEDDYECSYIGSVLSIFPSGKYYMPWTTNQTYKDVIKDTCFRDALEEYLDKYNMWLFSGEGDPTDLYIGRSII